MMFEKRETYMRYELTDLKLFNAIVQTKSLSSGAQVLHITASSASYRLKNLEQALGAPLFLRTKKGMELTPAGETLYRHVRDLLMGIELMHDEVGRFSAGLRGHIRLFANSSSLNSFIAPSVGRFLVAHPNVNIELEEHSSSEIEAAVSSQEADIGILAGEIESDLLALYPYARDELIVATPVKHPLSRHAVIRFSSALEYGFVCMARASTNFCFLQDEAQRLGRPLNVRLHAHTYQTVMALVEEGVGIALVPKSVAESSLANSRVVAVRLDEQWAERRLNIVVHNSRSLPTFTSAFLQVLLEDSHIGKTGSRH
jgi:DNA-binding transcriptional LysR family regulator